MGIEEAMVSASFLRFLKVNSMVSLAQFWIWIRLQHRWHDDDDQFGEGVVFEPNRSLAGTWVPLSWNAKDLQLILLNFLTAYRTSTLRWSCVLFVTWAQGAAAGRGCHSKCQSGNVCDLLSCIGPEIFLCDILSILAHKHTHCHKHKLSHWLSRLPERHRSASQCLHRPLSPPRHGLSTYHILSAKARRTKSWLPRLLRACLHRGFRRQHRYTEVGKSMVEFRCRFSTYPSEFLKPFSDALTSPSELL